MYDAERIGKIISDIEKYLRDLEELDIKEAKDLATLPNLGEGLSNLVFYRNLLSHEYYELTEKDVLDVSKKINVVKEFVERVKQLLR